MHQHPHLHMHKHDGSAKTAKTAKTTAITAVLTAATLVPKTALGITVPPVPTLYRVLRRLILQAGHSSVWTDRAKIISSSISSIVSISIIISTGYAIRSVVTV